MKIPFFLYLLLSLCCWNGLAADELGQSEKQLQQVTKELQALQKRLTTKEKETNKQKQALKNIELELGKLQKETALLVQNISLHSNQLIDLGAQRKELSERLDAKAEDIKSILRLAYKQNNQPLIKLLLSGGRPEDLSRHLYYFSVLTQNQQTQVTQWVTEQSLLAKTIENESEIIAKLEQERASLVKSQTELSRQKNKRAQMISKLQQETKSTQDTIAEKEQEREKLTGLIADIKAQLEAMNLDFPDNEFVSGAKGELNWPVEGKLVNRYGSVIDNSGLRWEGWLISAPDGEPVRAVHGGRIVFADFFKSNGLLVIIDHGDGVWTLYGRNQALLREVGSWVETGDIIAEVGRSGGYNQSALYFEVRKNGEPQNPASWLNKR